MVTKKSVLEQGSKMFVRKFDTPGYITFVDRVKQQARKNHFRYVWYAKGKVLIWQLDGEYSHMDNDVS